MSFNFLEQLPNNSAVAFVVGLLSAFPSLAPTALSLLKNPSCDLYKTAKLEDMFMKIPLFYGILHIVLFFLIHKLLPEKYRTYLTLGLIIGLLYPSFGWFNNHPQEVYGINSAPKLYLLAQAMYIPFFSIIINYLVTNMRK